MDMFDAAFRTIEDRRGLKAVLCRRGASVFSLSYKGLPLLMAEARREDFLHSRQYYGRTVGRFAGRIEDGRLEYAGIRLEVPPNEGKNALHGGPGNFAFRDFEAEEGENQVAYRLFSEDGDNGFPGNLALEVSYRFDEKGRLEIAYSYSSDRPTLVNLTNHGFYNAGGEQSVLRQKLFIPASKVMAYRYDLIPLGFRDLDTATDFTSPKEIGRDIGDPSLYETRTDGYDHCFLIGEHGYEEPVATLEGKRIRLSLYSDAPALQIFSDNGLYPGRPEYNFAREERHASVALEPVFAPLDYGSMLLLPGRTYTRKIAIGAEEIR